MRVRSSITIASLGLLLWATVCPAAESEAPSFEPSEHVDLPGLLVYARTHNPEIQTMEQRWRAARARPSQEGSLPDPMLNTAYHNEGFDRFRQGSSDFAWLRFGAEQEIPFPGKLSLKETIANREADREEALYRTAVLNVLARLRVAYSDYFLAHKSVEIVTRNKAFLETIAKAAEAKYQVGEGIQQDVLKAQVEISVLIDRLTGLQQKRQTLAAEINALLNQPPSAALGEPAPVEMPRLAYTLEELESMAREQSPRLAAAGSTLAGAESNLKLAKRQYYPDLVARADYFNKAALTPEWEVGLGIRVPLYFWRKQSYGVQEAAAGVSEARAARQSTSQDVLASVKDLHVQVTTADRLVTLYDSTILPQARLSLKSASAGYQVGKVDFLTLLNSFMLVLEYELRFYEELASFEKAVAQLEEAVGLPVLPAPQEASAR